MGIIKDQILHSIKVESFDDAIKLAGDTIDDLSKKMHDALECDNYTAQKAIIRGSKKVVHTASTISSDILNKHKDKLPSQIKPLTDALGDVLAGVATLTSEEGVTGVKTTNDDAKDAATAEKPKRHYQRRTVTEDNGAPVRTRKRRRKAGTVKRKSTTNNDAPVEAPITEAPAQEV